MQVAMVGFYKKVGFMNSFKDHDLKKIDKDYKYIAFGNVKVWFNGRDITDKCILVYSEGFNNSGHMLDKDGQYIIYFNRNHINIAHVACLKGESNPAFRYYPKKEPFVLSSKYSKLEALEMDFTDDNIQDGCKLRKWDSVNLKSVVRRKNYSLSIKKDMGIVGTRICEGF